MTVLALESISTDADNTKQKLKDDLTGACLKYMFTAEDSKSERKAKDDIDKVIGESSGYSDVCNYIL